MGYTLIHHTGCGASRKGLELLTANGIEPELRKYMNAGERLSEAELREIAAEMGGVSPRAFLREKDAAAYGLPESAGDDAVYAAMIAEPKLIQRPIGRKGGKAILGRPAERLLDIR